MAGFPTVDESASLELVRRIQEGDREAWDELYRRYHDQLLFAVRARLGAGLRRFMQSEDVFQSVALEAFHALPRFEYRGQGSLERFLKTLVLNKIRDRADTFAAGKRAAGRVEAVEDLDALAGGPAEPPRYHDGETYERLERALAALPESMREVLLLRKVDGLSSKEVSERLGKSDEAARKTYSRALARLATLMGADGRG